MWHVCPEHSTGTTLRMTLSAGMLCQLSGYDLPETGQPRSVARPPAIAPCVDTSGHLDAPHGKEKPGPDRVQAGAGEAPNDRLCSK
jgi:hypothetical protein